MELQDFFFIQLDIGIVVFLNHYASHAEAVLAAWEAGRIFAGDVEIRRSGPVFLFPEAGCGGT